MAKQDGERAKLEQLLETANGSKRSYLLALEDVLGAAREALGAAHGIAVRHGGTRMMGKTTLCLAVAVGGKVVVGLGETWADRPSPGRLWKDLGPWKQDFAGNVDKARAWAKAKAADRVTLSSAELGVEHAPKRETTAGSAGSLLRAVLAHPEDDAARLVYADFLTQSGDLRGELITVQCALATAAKTERKALLARERELLAGNAKAWSRHASQVAMECRFLRGFVGSIKANALSFAHHGAALFDTDPVEELVLSKPNGPGLLLLAGSKHLGKLRTLKFSSPFWMKNQKDVDALTRFFGSEGVKRLRGLEVILSLDPTIQIDDAIAGLSLPALETLALYVTGTPDAYEALPRATLPALRSLTVPTRRPALKAALRKAFPHAKLA